MKSGYCLEYFPFYKNPVSRARNFSVHAHKATSSYLSSLISRRHENILSIIGCVIGCIAVAALGERNIRICVVVCGVIRISNYIRKISKYLRNVKRSEFLDNIGALAFVIRTIST